MTIVEREIGKRPKPGTKYAVVFGALQTGVSRRDLPERTGLSGKVVSTAIGNLRHDGYLPKPTPEEKRAARSEAASLAQGGLSIAIQPYAKMKMSPREIKHALDLTNFANKLSVAQVASALRKGRARGDFPKLTPEDLHDIMLSTCASEEELKQRVRQWLNLRNQLTGNERDGESKSWLPTNRLEWKIFIHADTILKKIFENSRNLLEDLSPEQIIYLEKLVIAREKESKGDHSGFRDFLDFFTQNKEAGIELAKTLSKQRGAILKAIPMPDH